QRVAAPEQRGALGGRPLVVVLGARAVGILVVIDPAVPVVVEPVRALRHRRCRAAVRGVRRARAHQHERGRTARHDEPAQALRSHPPLPSLHARSPPGSGCSVCPPLEAEIAAAPRRAASAAATGASTASQTGVAPQRTQSVGTSGAATSATCTARSWGAIDACSRPWPSLHALGPVLATRTSGRPVSIARRRASIACWR